MKIYTRTGDKGLTSLFDGTRVSKDNLRVETYGTIDELNSAIGVAVTFLGKSDEKIKGQLVQIQKDLFEIGASLANPKEKLAEEFISRLKSNVDKFEHFIDSLTGKLPELTNFILPGGIWAGSVLHLARSISRRTERQVIKLNSVEKIDNSIVMYFNRLSDLLFTMSRAVNHKAKTKETIWSK